MINTNTPQPDVSLTPTETLSLIESESEKAYQHGLHKVWLKSNDDYDGMTIAAGHDLLVNFGEDDY